MFYNCTFTGPVAIAQSGAAATEHNQPLASSIPRRGSDSGNADSSSGAESDAETSAPLQVYDEETDPKRYMIAQETRSDIRRTDKALAATHPFPAMS